MSVSDPSKRRRPSRRLSDRRSAAVIATSCCRRHAGILPARDARGDFAVEIPPALPAPVRGTNMKII
jgi:hypothetical protein